MESEKYQVWGFAWGLTGLTPTSRTTTTLKFTLPQLENREVNCATPINGGLIVIKGFTRSALGPGFQKIDYDQSIGRGDAIVFIDIHKGGTGGRIGGHQNAACCILGVRPCWLFSSTQERTIYSIDNDDRWLENEK